MKTIRTKVYQFKELSKQAKQTALENYSYDAQYDFEDDAMQSLKKVAEYFNAPVEDWQMDWGQLSVGSTCGCYAKFDTWSEEDENITEEQLKNLIEGMGSYDHETLKGHGDCKFTGYCMDEDMCDGIRIAFYKGIRAINELLQAGFKSWLQTVAQDYEYQLSEQGYADLCEANEYDFTKEGKLFHQ